MTRIISITSGKSGVGKTLLGVSLAAQLAQRGQRLCLVDVEPGQHSAAVLAGLPARPGLRALASGEATPQQVLLHHQAGFDLLPAAVDGDWLDGLDAAQLQSLAAALGTLRGYDIILIDAPAGTGHRALAFALAATELLLVITPDPAALSDAYTLLGRLHAGQLDAPVRVVVNRSRNYIVAQHSYNKLREVARHHLAIQPTLLGMVGEHQPQQRADAQTGSLAATDAALLRDMVVLAERLLSEPVPGTDVAEFGQRYGRAAGVAEPARDAGVAGIPVTPGDGQPARRVDDQFEVLSARLDALIAEVERLRAVPPARRSEVTTGTEPHQARLPESLGHWLQELADGVERLDLGDQSFAVYHSVDAHGAVHLFACHSRNDDIEPSESSTRNH